jgi:O-methyltransferase involved in polyketide biosynthesis
MQASSASRTALAASLMRAVHTRFDHPALIDDPWGERLVPESEQNAIREAVTSALSPEARTRLDALASPEAVLHAGLSASPMYGTVIVRTRYAEDALAAAVTRGMRQ